MVWEKEICGFIRNGEKGCRLPIHVMREDKLSKAKPEHHDVRGGVYPNITIGRAWRACT